MANIFMSFKTDDTGRVQPIYDAFKAHGYSVFWSNNIRKGAPDYQAIIRKEIREAPVVVVIWTSASAQSSPVIQESSQAEHDGKLFQVLLDNLQSIDLPMDVRFNAQKRHFSSDGPVISGTRMD